jgi:hypothetical protein
MIETDMTDRTTETKITFRHRFSVPQLQQPLGAGTYRVTTDEEEIVGLSFIAYQRTSTMLHIPAIGASTNTTQYLQVSPEDLEAALLKDAGEPSPAARTDNLYSRQTMLAKSREQRSFNSK